MKVAHLLRKYNPSEWGGTETAIHQLTSGLRRQSVDSIVYCPETDEAVPSADPLAESGCAVKRFHACVPIWGIPPERKRQLLAVGGNLMSFDLIYSLAFEPGLSLVHSHALGRVGGIGLTVARRRGLPFVVTVHGGVYDLPQSMRDEFNATDRAGWEWGKPFGLLFRSRYLLDEADAVITCNPKEAELIRRNHPGRQVVVQPHGVPAASFRADRRDAALAAFPQIAGRPVFISAGRIDPVKNQGWLVDEMPELLRRHPAALLVLVGACTDEAYGAALGAKIGKLGLSGSVLLAGKLPPGDPRLIGLMQYAKAVVLPSLSETFGLVILEAWAAGTAVLSSRTSGATALVEDGVNGALFGLDAPGQFHAGVDTLIARPETRAAWIEAGRTRAVSEYDTEVLAARMKRLYMNLIDSSHAHGHPA